MNQPLALVTGSSRGIGRAIACQLAADGFFVIVNYRVGEEAANAVCAQIQQQGGAGVPWQFDLADPLQVRNAIRSITREYGTIDVLVNNAACGMLKPLTRVKQDDWNRIMQTNLSGLHYCTQALVKTWTGKSCGSRIINITSIGAECGFRDSSSYSASKAGVIGFTKALAVELGPKGVTVNAVAPGYIATDMTADMPGDEIVAKTPLGRAGRPEDVANLVSFLASERAGFITGEVIRINGGLYT